MPPAEVASLSETHPLLPPPGAGRTAGRAPDGETPASVAAVAAALAAGPRTYRDLVETTGLPGRTVRWAVRRLRDDGVAGAQVSLRDGRRTWFFLRAPVPARPRPRVL